MHVLVLDDTLGLSAPVGRLASLRGWQTHFVGSLHELELARQVHGQPVLVLINLEPPLTAWELGRRLRALELAGPVVVVSAADSEGDLSGLPGVVAIDRSLDAAELEQELERVVSGLGLAGRIITQHGIVGQSQELRKVLTRIEKAAPGNANVCISGESGTGKELIARAIHTQSARADRPLVTLDVTAIPEGLMESHLFGHVRGSFTGAVEHRTGFFALADTGTLFIDEISELSLPLQAKLLRAIQMREFVKVGDSKPTCTDIRLITASNRDLRRAVREGTFREDLYYRIAVIMIDVPPLRERQADIPLLAEYFVRKFSAVHRKPVPRLLPGALERLATYEWPGNVRQLENCIEQAVVLCEEDVIDVNVLPLGDSVQSLSNDRGASGARALPPSLTLRELEHQYIVQTLASVGGNRSRAARVLGISLRGLQYKLKAYRQEGREPLASFGGASRADEESRVRRSASSASPRTP